MLCVVNVYRKAAHLLEKRSSNRDRRGVNQAIPHPVSCQKIGDDAGKVFLAKDGGVFELAVAVDAVAKTEKVSFRILLNQPGHLLQVSRLPRSEVHTSELQSRGQLVCRLLLENTNGMTKQSPYTT